MKASYFVLAIDAAGVVGARLALRSILTYHGSRFRTVVMVDDDETGRRLINGISDLPAAWQRSVAVERVDPSAADFNRTGTHLPTAAAYRLLAPALLRGQCSQFVYLDYDTQCVRSAAGLLGHRMRKGSIVAGVLSGLVGVRARSTHAGLIPPSPLDRPDHYFNSGVLAIDIERWQSAEISATTFGLMRSHAFPYADQDALNIALSDAWDEVDPSYNVQTSFMLGRHDARSRNERAAGSAIDAALRRPRIIHFNGPQKPWDPLPHSLLTDVAERSGYATMQRLTPRRLLGKSPLIQRTPRRTR